MRVSEAEGVDMHGKRRKVRGSCGGCMICNCKISGLVKLRLYRKLYKSFTNAIENFY